MKRKDITGVFASFLYLICFIFFDDVPLYLLGGFFSVILKVFDLQDYFYYFWLAFLLLTMLFYRLVSLRISKVILLCLIWMLLNGVDLISCGVSEYVSYFQIFCNHNYLNLLLKIIVFWIFLEFDCNIINNKICHKIVNE